MNILISVDNKYLEIAKVMLFSLKNNVSEKINVYVLYQGDNNAFDQFKNVMKKMGINAFKIEVEEGLVQGLTVGFHYSAAMYFRIFAHLLLPENIERVLYLDADLIIKKDITSFYNQDFEDKYMVVCCDKYCEREDVSKQKEKLGISKEHKYFNSGVLLMNLEKMRKDISKELLLSYIVRLQDKLLYPDQDILNTIYENKVKYNDYSEYNFQTFKKDKVSNSQLKDAYTLHFVGEEKPWQYNGIISDISKYFWFYKCRMNKVYVLEYGYTYILGIAYEICSNIKRIAKKILRK